MGGRGSNHDGWVLAGPHEASRAQSPLIEAGRLPHNIGPAGAKMQEDTIAPKASWGRIPSQDPEHRPQHFRRQVLLPKPHAVFVPRKFPHPARVALERSNATLEELLCHLGCCHIERPQTLEAALDEGEPGAHEHLMVPTRVGNNRQGRVREQGVGHSDVHVQPPQSEPGLRRRKAEVDP